MACSKEKESEERVEAVDSHPINALNADHNAGVANIRIWRTYRAALDRGERTERGVAGRVKGGWLRDARHREITSRVSHPRVGGWVERTLSTPRPWTTVQPGICLVSLFMRFNIVIWHRTGEF